MIARYQLPPAARTLSASNLTHGCIQRKKCLQVAVGIVSPPSSQKSFSSVSLVLKSILHSALIKRTNYRKSCGLSVRLLSQEGVEMRSAELSFHSYGKAVPTLAQQFLSVSVPWELLLVQQPYLPSVRNWVISCCCLVLDCSL